MTCSEELIPFVYSKPEIWDQSHMHYTSKPLKVKAWAYISDKLGVSADVAKARWTNLRDLFRRELKKTLKLAEETGDPNAYKPRWKHFKTMLFLKDQIIKDESASSLQFDDTDFSLYPQTILEDGDGIKFEEDGYFEDESSPSSTPSHQEVAILPELSRKRNGEMNEDHFHTQTSSKRRRWEHASNGSTSSRNYVDCNPRTLNEVDEDYHFVMSILPSIRRIRQDRKTSFKMRVLQLIVEEECS